MSSRTSNDGDDGAAHMTLGLGRRVMTPELMDDPGIDAAEHKQALDGLERCNRWSRSDAILWPVLCNVAKAKYSSAIRVLDVATGAGDVPIALWRRAKRAGIEVTIDACDVSRTALDYAMGQAAAVEADVRFFHADAVYDRLPPGYDLVTCSLFLHHLTEAEGVRLLKNMASAAETLAVSDLARSRVGYWLAWFATRILSRSRIVHYDGPVSVRAALTKCEALQLAERAGLQAASASSQWPCRYLLTWSRTA